jgi:hypothetical protein
MIAKLAGLLLALSATIAVGAPENDGAPTEKKVFPLVKEGEQWWAGVSDICGIVGAEFEGEGVAVKVDRGKGLVVRAWAQIGGNGPFKIKVGDDTYQFKLDELAITKNDEEFGDFVMQPKRIERGVCATLEDLGRILSFEVGDEVGGQPTISKDGKQYRLVKGEPHWPGVLKDGEVVQINPEELQKRMEAAPFVWKGFPLRPGERVTIPSATGGAYTEHNGMLYRRATAQIRMGPTIITPDGPGMETLYGPVVPNRFHAEGASADLMYLSIVKRPLRTGGVVRIAPGMPKAKPRGDDDEGR